MNRDETTALVDRARRGSGPALDALYARAAAKLLPLIRVRLGPALRSDLESRDILQTVLLKSFERFEQFEGAHSGSWMAWLARIAEHEILDRADFRSRRRRDAARRAPLDEVTNLPAPVRSALSQAIVSEQAARLERALGSLSEAHREIIVLRQFEELTFPEIAARLGKTDDACRMSYARAMTALTIAMADQP